MTEQMEVDTEKDLSMPVSTTDGVPVYPEVVVPEPPPAIQSFDGTGPRLMITHIVNENFKSYAGEELLGPFHKNFSSIVGPNGSGKSNVIDSMLFVFGYRSSKIRSKKIGVLIHNSTQHPNCASCTVAVHFQKIIDTGEGENDYDVVPNSQFVVSRTAFKDNSSYYRVDGKKVTYKQVSELLMKKGIDLEHNRFLILQGEVEQIAMMKPKALTEHEDGMLEFLEDIIGSSRYMAPIDVLNKRVEDLNELRGEKLNRVKAVEKEKNELEDVKNEAIEYLQSQNEITKQQNKLYQKYLCVCEESQASIQEKQKAVLDAKKAIDERIDAIKASKKEKGREYKKIFKQFEELQAKCEESKEKFSEFDKLDVKLREDLKYARAKSKKLDKSLEQEKKKLEELEQIPEKTERDLEEFGKKLEKYEADKEKEEAKMKEVLDSLKTETQDLQVEKEQKEEVLMGLQKIANEAKSKYSVADSELQLYLSNLQSEENKLKSTERNLSHTTSNIRDRKAGLADMESRLPEMENALKKATADLQHVTDQETKLAEAVRSVRYKVEEARGSMHAHASRGKVIDAIMALKRAGTMPGIYGRLGDLGAIDEKYDVAISTACGSLDHIVVDNLETGQKCVQFLKKNNVGVSTFIALDKMARWKQHANSKINTPENVPRLFDLIKVHDQDLLPAFYFALRNTLVAKDLEQATRISYGKTRHRVVTLNGQLIETSGTMSGGGGRVSKGRMGTSVAVMEIDPDELESMEKQLEKDSQEQAVCRRNKAKLEDTVHKLEKQVKEMRHGLQKFRVEIEKMVEQQHSLEQQVKDQEKRVHEAAPDEKQLKQLEKTVATFKKDYEKVKADADRAEGEVHELHKQIMNIGGTKMKSAESRVNLVQTQIDTITGHITKAKVAVKTAQRNAKKSADKVKSLEEEITENKEHITKLEEEFKQVEQSATAVLQAYTKAQEEMKEVEGTVEEMKSKMAEFEEQEQEINKEKIDIGHELEKYETSIKENATKIKHWKKELDKLQLAKIETEEPEALPKYPAEELAEVSKEDTQFAITVLEEKLAQMKPNMAAIQEYRKKESMYLKRVEELDRITSLRDTQRAQMEDLRKRRLDEFMAGFSVITNKLKEMYQMITLGGDAELELVDSLDPFSEGIVFSVRPPKKSWKNISNLSGGEKTLSSLALVFALHHYKPTPLYVMDEIDAALDFKNVSIVGHYIKERTKNAQFIIISLRNNMFELADRLVGIYKTYDCTKSVTINPHKIAQPLQNLDTNRIPLATEQNTAPNGVATNTASGSVDQNAGPVAMDQNTAPDESAANNTAPHGPDQNTVPV